MFADLNVFRTAHAMAVHAGQRQSIVAQNMANSDTPGYQARDIVPFAQMVSTGTTKGTSNTEMRASRAGHLHGESGGSPVWETFIRPGTADPNGNTVSLETEMFKAIEVKRQHDRALAIYKSSLAILRTSLGRGG